MRKKKNENNQNKILDLIFRKSEDNDRNDGMKIINYGTFYFKMPPKCLCIIGKATINYKTKDTN